MNTVIVITEIVLGCGVLLAVLAAIIMGILSLCEKEINRWYVRGQQAQWETDRRRLRDKAYWFSEDVATMNLIKSLADEPDRTAIARDIWRKERSAMAPPPEARP